MNNYFKTRGNRKWIFAAKKEHGEEKLIIEADTPIRRHVKIKASANSHDPVWKEYFATRKKQMKESIPWWSRAPEGAFVEA